MPRIHKTFHFLLSNEIPSQVVFDLVYRPEPNATWPSTALVVDYDLSKIHKMRPQEWKCVELEDLSGRFERMLIHVTQFDSLQQVKRDVYAAARTLAPLGELRVTVPPKSGAKRITSDINQVFKKVDVVKNGGRALLICREPAPQPFQESPAYAQYDDPVSGQALRFLVRPGIFSGERIDKGTEFLLRTISDINGKSILDVGCGYGAIGVVCAARGADASLLDVDARVVKLAAANLSLNGFAGKTLLKLQPYDFEDGTFDIVLANPPTHAGSETLRALFKEMVRVSSDKGYVALVVREHLHYEKWLNDFGDVKRLDTADGYKVLQIRKRDPARSMESQR
jgi:16S rRNA (guanine1207-N2)-methyltransferase